MASPSSSSNSDAGPPRKRPRSEVSSEERKEARAHRNRIAAQNSRDKRKAQFVLLERKVAELEEENKRLKAGILVAPYQPALDQSTRDKENEELRERIKTLEKGWDAVLKALAAQGLPLQFPVQPQLQPQPTSSPSLPVPSPSPSNTSLDSDLSLFSSASTPSSPEPKQEDALEEDSTRHLAAGGFQPLFTFDTGSTYSSNTTLNIDTHIPHPVQEGSDAFADHTMESLFREILVDHAEAQGANSAIDFSNQEGADSPSHFTIAEETKATSPLEEMILEAYAVESPESTSSLLFGSPDPVLDIDVDLDFDNDELKKLLDEYCTVPALSTPAQMPVSLPEGLSVF